MKIFNKVRYPNGRRHVYFCGIKVFSYSRRPVTFCPGVQPNNDWIKYLSPDGIQKLLRDRFYAETGKLPNERLQSLNEKIKWHMMFNVSPLRVLVADKYTVRDYVRNKIGAQYLIPLLGCWDSPDDINLDEMPDRFVLKYSEGSAKVMLVPDKKQLNIDYVRSKIRQWSIDEYWTHFMEMQYRDSARKIIAEDFIDTKIEYKLWCFHGQVKFIKIEIMDGFAENGKTDHQYGKYFYPDWTPADFRTIGDEPEYEISRPVQLELLIELAQQLASEFDFVRVDFFETNSGDLRFGEMTLSPAAGNVHFIPESKNVEFGQWL